MSFTPKEIEELLNDHFDYPDMIIAQVATISEEGIGIRSMALFQIDDVGQAIFLTNRKSHKWLQLSMHPHLSMLLLNSKKDVQIIARGEAELLTLESHRELLEKYWSYVPMQARVSYLHKNPEGEYEPLNTSSQLDTPPENFGMIRLKPQAWETLIVDSENYHLSHRYAIVKNNNIWQRKRLNAI